MLNTLALSQTNRIERTKAELLTGLLHKRCSFSFVRALFGNDADVHVSE